MKKLLLFLLMLLPITASAYDFMVDGVAYNILSTTDLTCVVTEGCVPNNGKLMIPATVNYKNRTLTVVGIGDGEPIADYQSVTNLTIENGPTYIEGDAIRFQMIQVVRIPPSIKLIKSDAFGGNYGHSGLASWIGDPIEVIIEDGDDDLEGERPTFFPYPFNGCLITRLYLGRSIDDKLFNGLGSLEEFTIGDKVTSVLSEGVSMSYYMSSLKKLTVGKNLQTVPNFQEESIDEIYMRSETPPLSEGFTEGTYGSATLYVPRGTKEVYEKAATWQNFWTIEEYDVKDNGSNRTDYAEYDSETGTLTFKYGNKPEGDNIFETIYDLAAYKKKYGYGFISPWYDLHDNLKTIVFDESYSEALPTNTTLWFAGLSKLTTIKGIEYLNTSEVTEMRNMFWACSNLYQIDLRNFDTRNVTNMSGMFADCSALTAIYVGENWSTEKVSSESSLFSGCNKLVGGSGTVFDSNHIGLDYARIDGGASGPGYLSTIFIMGDVNGDWFISIKDVNLVIDYIMGRVPEKFNFFAADMNKDYKLDAVDLVLLINSRWDK